MRVPTAELAAAAGPTTRAIRFTQPALMLTIALALVLWQADTLQTPATAVWTVRGAALVLIAGALTAFDDPSGLQVAAAPLPLSWRVAPRILFALAVVSIPLVVLAALAQLPIDSLALEAGALLALATGTCLMLSRRGVHEPSTAVGTALLLVPPALLLLPERAALLVPPGPLWGPAHERWAILLAAGALLLALSLRDPARPAIPRMAQRPAPLRRSR